MKKILLATTILAASAGFASAEVTLSGSARMGLYGETGSDTTFTSRARVTFNMSGETDGGLSFGASFRADNARNGDGLSANDGDAGSVYISGAFGKLSMGDVDGAGAATLGQVSYVGLTSLGSLNEVKYLSSGGLSTTTGAFPTSTVYHLTADPSALYSYSTGDLTVNVSATNPSGIFTAYGIGAKYAMGAYSVGIAYEQADVMGNTMSNVMLGGSATFGAATVKAIVGQASFLGTNYDQYALSADYKMDAITVTAFYSDSEDLAGTPFGGQKAYGIGASYDLGGGASVMGGYVKDKTNDTDAFDLGVSMSF